MCTLAKLRFFLYLNLNLFLISFERYVLLSLDDQLLNRLLSGVIIPLAREAHLLLKPFKPSIGVYRNVYRTQLF